MKYDLPDELSISGDGPIRTLTLVRPSRLNAIHDPMHRGLADVWRQIGEDEDARVVILTGAGRGFCAGGDLHWIMESTTDPAMQYRNLVHARRIVTEMIDFRLPVIAAVNGPAMGLGCSIAMLCDIVIASERALFGDPHVSVGLVAADGGALTWPLLMSLMRAKEYLFTGDTIDAATAERLGMVNHVVPHDELLDRAYALADKLASQPRRALVDTKRAVNVHLSRAVAAVMDFAFAAENVTMSLPEFRENLARHASSK